MGITSFNTYNSIFNITSENIKIEYFDGTVWRDVIFNPGAYEIEQINYEIYRQISLELNLQDSSQAPIRLEANDCTLHSIIYLKDDYKIDINQKGTLRDILGFEPIIIDQEYNYSKYKRNITDIHWIHLCSDCIIVSIRNRKKSNVYFTFVLDEVPEANVVRHPTQVIYKHIEKKTLDFMEIWMEDNNGNIFDNHGEDIAFTLHNKNS